MKFKISRVTYNYLHQDFMPPCKEAVKDGENWYIEISTLDELCALVERENSIIIYPNNGDDEHCSLLIYDEYIE